MAEHKGYYTSPVFRLNQDDQLPTVRFFIINHDRRDMERNQLGAVLIFLQREAAQKHAEAANIREFSVAGMTEKTWTLFQHNEQFVVVNG